MKKISCNYPESSILFFAADSGRWMHSHIPTILNAILTGEQLHKKAHDVSLKEKRGDVIIERAMPIHSRELGISGECDVVEFYESQNGVKLSGHTGKYIAIPIEYKRGRPKTNEADILQLTAQAICIEEMLCCDIPYGYIYYGETRHRQKVEITVELRQKVKMIFEEMHKYLCLETDTF